jgi:hypothetical protein
MNPLENQSSSPRPPGAAQGNQLARLAGPLPGLPPPPPAPTAAQSNGTSTDKTADLSRPKSAPGTIASLTRLIAGCVRFFTLSQCFDGPA